MAPGSGTPGTLLQRIIERHTPELLVPVQPASREDNTWAIAYGFYQSWYRKFEQAAKWRICYL